MPAQSTTAKKKTPQKKAAGTITVTAKQNSRWRCGRNFGRDPVTIKVSDLKRGELAQLKADPCLVVETVTD